MKLDTNHIIFFSLVLILPFVGFLSPNGLFENLNSRQSNDKAIRQLLSKMIRIEGDTFAMGQMSRFQINITPSDSNLLIGLMPRRTGIESFYIGATEITNEEWRVFYQSKVNEIGKGKAKSSFYPDTSLWVKEFPYSYNEPMAMNYFIHPIFNNYPVVGITWEQANAYCNWKSEKLRALFEKVGIKNVPMFRLPTEAEWEYAAINKTVQNKHDRRSSYSWPENKLLNINKLTNIGQIIDNNNIIFKPYHEDGCLYTCEVASYPSNDNGIYNMAGNVAEWTSSQAYVESVGSDYSSYKSMTDASEIDAEISRIQNDSEVKDNELREILLGYLQHNRKVLNTKNMKICKGGSWADGLIYTQVGSRRGIHKEKASTKIGFRIAMSNVDPAVLKYFPKKNWKP